MNVDKLIRVLPLPAFIAASALICDNAAAQVSPDALRASAALSSDFVHNGILQTDGEASLRVAMDFEHDSGFFAGGSLMNVEYRVEDSLPDSRDAQLGLYAGYAWRPGQWQTSATISRYEYPGYDGNRDYLQTSISASYRDRYFLTFSHSDDYLKFYGNTRQLTAGLALPWVRDLEFSMSAGRLEFAEPFSSSWSYWDVGLSRAFRRLALDLRYHDNSLRRNIVAGTPADDQWVLSMTYSLLPLPRSRDRR